MATATFQAIKNRMMTIGVCASLVVGSLGFAASAEARMPAGTARTDGLSTVCGYFQDMYDAANSKGIGAQAVNQNDQQWAQNQKTRETASEEWHKAGCDDAYGNIGAIQHATTSSTVAAAQISASSMKAK